MTPAAALGGLDVAARRAHSGCVPKVILYMEQEGEGCDYTIGCGRRAVEFEVSHWGEVADKAREIVRETEGAGRVRLRRAVVAADPIDLPVEAWRAEDDAVRAREAQAARLAEQRAEYERLHALFGGGS